ncbi:MAG: helix-turn-helix transcriptional regulator [candidate division Zixibacteria bacterium]|nr:helix-turn-helix transcriptional regulator [candidate division Zixibacteria bacterium]
MLRLLSKGRQTRPLRKCRGEIGSLRSALDFFLDIYPLRIYVAGVKRDKVNTPLTPAVLHILLALSARERHGYGIMKQVASDSQGKVKMGPGTLYGSIGRMLEAGLIAESDKKVDPELDDERRVYYKITGLGRKTLAAELERYREVVSVAKLKGLSPDASAYGF